MNKNDYNIDEIIKQMDYDTEREKNYNEALKIKKFYLAQDREKYNNKVMRAKEIMKNAAQIFLVGLGITMVLVCCSMDYQFNQEDFRRELDRNRNSLEHYMDEAEFSTLKGK